MVYLDSEDIQTTRLSKKLSHCRLGPYPVERCVRKYAYRLVLPPLMRRLHPVSMRKRFLLGFTGIDVLRAIPVVRWECSQ